MSEAMLYVPPPHQSPPLPGFLRGGLAHPPTGASLPMGATAWLPRQVEHDSCGRAAARPPPDQQYSATARGFWSATPKIHLMQVSLGGTEPVKLGGRLGGGVVISPTGSMPYRSEMSPTGSIPYPSEMSCDSPSSSGGGIPSSGAEKDAVPGDSHEDAVGILESPKKKKKARFCKGKRDSYKRLVERLVEEAKADPDNYTIRVDRLPPSVSPDAESVERLLATVQRFARAARVPAE
mmetsp:Transcript_44284/g.128835  ORF Transcript_44284/g.128835 Transcript_44284/m.128835 type:complete len:236 (+) Transcript_44284:54-761(+)